MIETDTLLQRGNQQSVVEQAAGQADVVEALLAAQSFDDLADFLGANLLHGGGQAAALFVGELGGRAGQARLLPELGRKNEAPADSMTEIAGVETQRAGPGLAQHVAEDVAIQGLAAQPEPLRLVLVGVRNKAEEFGDLGKQPGQGVGITDIAHFAQSRTFANGDYAGFAVAVFVHGEDECSFRTVKGRRRWRRG